MQALRLISASMMLIAIGLFGCDRQDTVTTDTTVEPTPGQRVEGAMERTGDALDEAAQRTGETVGRAVDEADTRAREAGAAIRDRARDLAADLGTSIPNLLADSTEAAMLQGGMHDLVERFSEADRNRIGDVQRDSFPELDSEIARFRQAWKTKYGREFEIDDERAVFSFVTVQGNETDSNRGTVIFPARQGMSELRIPVVRETGGWRIDVPDNMTAQQIATNLLSGLRPLNAGDPALPDDIMEGYRSSAHGAMAAIMGEQRN